jgi:nucleoside-diphosphate-sugar epimerase
MKLLITGSSGFIGKYIVKKLISKKDYQLTKVGRNVNNDIVASLVDYDTLKNKITGNYDVIIHAAGLAHILPDTKNSQELYNKVNFIGTINLCKVIGSLRVMPKLLIYISTINVYCTSKEQLNITENVDLDPQTPSAISKMQAEKYLLEWGHRNKINILILRLPLVVGSNPPGNLGKMIKMIKFGTYFSIGGGRARKSMVLAEDVAKLIAECPDVSGIYNLTDGYHPSFAELESMICEQLKKPNPFNMPLGFAKILGKIGDLIPLFPVNTDTINKITQDLTFSDLKARHELGWNPSRVIDKWKI